MENNMNNFVSKPQTMWISLTDICNNKCTWCYEQGNHADKLKYIERETIKKILATMPIVGIKKCILIGGEPTLHPELHEIISDLKEKNLSVSLISNGRQFTKRSNVEKLKATKLDSLMLSIHGWSEETYFRFTLSKHGFKELKTSIRLLQEYKIPFGINVVISKFTSNEIDNIIDFIKWIGLTRASFNIAAPAVSRNGTDSSFVAEMKDYKTQVMEMHSKCKLQGIKANFNLTLPHCIFSDDEFTELTQNGSVVSGCHLLKGGGVVFKTNGAIAACTHIADFEIANTNTAIKILETPDSFLSFWNSNELMETRQKANCYRSDECSTCSHWSHCGGGCLIHWSRNDTEKMNLRSMPSVKF